VNHDSFFTVKSICCLFRYYKLNYGHALSDSYYKSVLHVLFKGSEFFPFVLQQQLTTLDFVSYCGGSLGLFLGFSALSAVEIVYYLTVRWMFLKYKKRRVSSEQSEDQTKPKNYLAEFMENSSIHGFNQTVKENRHFVERFESC
jgi:hypothetical protein